MMPLDDFLKLLAQAGTLLNVELDLYLDLLLASRPYVFAQRLNLFASASTLDIEVANFAL